MRTVARQQEQIPFLQGYEGAQELHSTRLGCSPKCGDYGGAQAQQIAAGYADKTNKSRTENKTKPESTKNEKKQKQKTKTFNGKWRKTRRAAEDLQHKYFSLQTNDMKSDKNTNGEQNVNCGIYLYIKSWFFALTVVSVAMAAAILQKLQQNGGRKKINCTAWWVLSEWGRWWWPSRQWA